MKRHEALRNLLKDKGLSQVEFSKLIGISRVSIGKWLRNEVEIDDSKWLLINSRLNNDNQVIVNDNQETDFDDITAKRTTLATEIMDQAYLLKGLVERYDALLKRADGLGVSTSGWSSQDPQDINMDAIRKLINT